MTFAFQLINEKEVKMAYVKSKKRVNKKCDRCGNILKNRCAHAKYCKNCARIREKEYHKLKRQKDTKVG